MELEGEAHILSARSGIAIPKGKVHQARNDGKDDAHFIIVSSPTSRGDRHNLPTA